MINFKGIYLPDGERHLVDWMSVSGQELGGKPAYQLHKYEAALPYAPGRRRAVDVGAHVGLWTRAMARDFAHVDAFEPVPAYAACFEMNVVDLPAGKVALRPIALGADAGVVGLTCPNPESHGDTWVAGPGEEANAAAEVEMRALDSYEMTDVDLIKIDCEGYEQRVLEGAKLTLLRCRPVVVVEQKPGRPEARGLERVGAVEYLKGLGAKVCREISGDYIMTWF